MTDNAHAESHPLRWPDGQPRTRNQDRQARGTWRKRLPQYMQDLAKELKRSGATEWEITSSLQNEATSDPGVAVYFSRRATNAFAWQEALGFIGQTPTVDAINKAYRERIRRVDPDGPTPDVALFIALTEHRNRAVDYVLGRHRTDHEYVIAIDNFDELRLNVNAVRVVLYSLRRIDDCGSPLMLERAFRGFHKQITAGASEVTVGESTVA